MEKTLNKQALFFQGALESKVAKGTRTSAKHKDKRVWLGHARRKLPRPPLTLRRLLLARGAIRAFKSELARKALEQGRGR